VRLEHIHRLLDDERYVGAEGFGGQAEFDELNKVSMLRREIARCVTDLLLLHQLCIWAVIDDASAKDRHGEWLVDLLSVEVGDLAVKDEIIALDAEKDGRLFAEENEGEDIAVLSMKVRSAVLGLSTWAFCTFSLHWKKKL